MTGKKWTESEKALLWTDMSNKEICEATGRTMDAVLTKRFNETGHYVPPKEARRREYIRTSAANSTWVDEITKVNRIIILAGKLGVRIKGVK